MSGSCRAMRHGCTISFLGEEKKIKEKKRKEKEKKDGMQFGPLKHPFGNRRLHNNDEVDVFVRELLRMQEPDLFWYSYNEI